MSVELVSGPFPRTVPGEPADPVAALLLSVAAGDHEAFVALQSRMAGLLRVNVRRILRDATRAEAVTKETFADVLEDAISFDPHLGDAQTWLLIRAHQHAMDEVLRSQATDEHRSVDAMHELRSVDATHAPRGARIDHAAPALLA